MHHHHYFKYLIYCKYTMSQTPRSYYVVFVCLSCPNKWRRKPYGAVGCWTSCTASVTVEAKETELAQEDEASFEPQYNNNKKD